MGGVWSRARARMLRAAFFAVIAVSLLFLVPAAALAVSVSGAVTDQTTGLPIPGATVTVSGGEWVIWWEDTLTAADGTFSLSAYSFSDTTGYLNVSAPGYRPEGMTLNLSQSPFSGMNFALEPSVVNVRGTVTDADSNPLSSDVGAEVTMLRYEQEVLDYVEWDWATPDDSGLYEFWDTDDGSYRLMAVAQGFQREVSTGFTLPGALVVRDFALDVSPIGSYGTVRGTVISTMSGIPGATITVLDADTDQVVTEVTTSGDGSYLIDLPPGQYTLSFSAESHHSEFQSVTVVANETAYVDVSLDEYALVKVVDKATGLPIYDFGVGYQGEWAGSTGTDRDGFAQIPVNIYSLTCGSSDYVTQSFTIDGRDSIPDVVEMQLKPTSGVLYGTLRDSGTGAAIARGVNEWLVDVDIYEAVGADWTTVQWNRGSSTGTWVQPLVAGKSYRVSAWDNEGEYAYEFAGDAKFVEDSAAQLVGAGSARNVPFDLDPAATITGAVTGPQGKVATEDYCGQRVEVWAQNKAGVWKSYMWWDNAGPDYLVKGLPAGSYKLFIHTLLVDEISGEPEWSGQSALFTDAWFAPGAAVLLNGTSEKSAKMALAPALAVSKSQQSTGKDFVLTGANAPTPAVSARVGGSNRYDVAINLSNELRSKRGTPFTDVVVACGEDRAMADPLGAAGLAGAYECPVLLMPSAKANEGTLAAIAAMRNANGGKINIHVVGGTSSIPGTIYSKIAALKGTGTCERIDAPNRYALAWKMADRIKTVMAGKGESISGVMVVNIENSKSFNDALAASPISARGHMPLIGVRGSSIPGEASAALALFPTAKKYAVNSAYLTSGVRSGAKCESTPMATSAERETAATQIARFGIDNGFVSCTNIGLANKLSDALPAGALMGQLDGVLVYTNASPLSTTTRDFCASVKAGVDKGWVFGGPTSIADSTKTAFHNALQ